MCGRFTNRHTWDELVALYRLTDQGDDPGWSPSYNIAPSELARVIRVNRDTGERKLSLLQWGLSGLGQGPEDRLLDHQRPRRDGRGEAGVPGSVPAATVPREPCSTQARHRAIGEGRPAGASHESRDIRSAFGLGSD
jgi:hypothetical protein